MLFGTPELNEVEMEVVARIDEIRAQVQFVSAEPKQWKGLLGPLFLAPSMGGWHSRDDRLTDAPLAEGTSLDAASLDPRCEDHRALTGYSEAMKYILHLHDDPHFFYQEGFVRSVHFMMLSYNPGKNPGRWRPGPIGVRRKGEILYEAPPAESVPDLMRELMARLNETNAGPAIVRAAIAHLNLAKIHPFTDGNGRVARALHTLVMARERIIEPEFCSIEEYAGRNRHRYFESLSDVGATTWSPDGDARPFLRFCLTAHLHQAERVLGDARRMGEVWATAEKEIQNRRFPDRLTFALADAAFEGELALVAYQQWAGGSEGRARKDLALLVEHGLLIRARARRGFSYKAGPLAQEIRDRAWAIYPPRAPLDPFEGR